MRRSFTSTALVLALVGVLAGCGGGTDDRQSAQALAAELAQAVQAASVAAVDTGGAVGSATDAVLPSTTPVQTPVAAAVTRTVGRTGWYAGFAITVDDVTAEPGYGTGIDLTVAMTYTNQGIEADSPPQGDVVADGMATDAFFDTPDIPAGGTATGTATFSLLPDTALTPDAAIDLVSIVYGDSRDNQTLLPLAADATVQSVQPLTLPLTGNLTQGEIVIDVVSGALAPSYESGEKGKALLDVRVKLTCAAGCNAAGWNTGSEQFSVTDPAGHSVVADQRSEYCCDALYPDTVSDSERNILTFVVPLPGTGTYTLTYDNPNITATGVAPATFAFTV